MKITLDDIDKTAEEILYGALLTHKLSNEVVDIEDVIEKTSVKLRQLADTPLFWNSVYTDDKIIKPIKQRLTLVAIIIYLQETENEPKGKLEMVQGILEEHFDPPKDLLSLELLNTLFLTLNLINNMDIDEFEALEAEYYKPCPILAKFYDTKDSQFENLEEALAISLKRNLDALKSAIKADIDVQSGVLADFQSEFTDNLQQILTEFAEYLNSSFPSQMYRKETFDKMKNREEELKSRLELKNLGGPSVSRIRVTKEKKSPKKIAFDSSLDHIDIGQHSTQFVRKINIQSKPKESNIHPRLRNHFLYRYLHPAPKPKSEKVAPWFNRPSTHTSNLFKSADFHQLWNQYKPGKATSPKKVRPLSRLQNYSSP